MMLNSRNWARNLISKSTKKGFKKTSANEDKEDTDKASVG